MIINKVLTIGDCSNRDRYVYRQAVRAVVFKDNKLLVIHTNKGDYKFPGGGIEQEENHNDALIREVREEAGLQVKRVKDLIGVIIEQRPDIVEPMTIFEMKSYYYLCEVDSRQEEQALDEYEAEQEFTPAWISLDEALSKNKELIEHTKYGLNPWVIREAYVMQELKDTFLIGGTRIGEIESNS